MESQPTKSPSESSDGLQEHLDLMGVKTLAEANAELKRLFANSISMGVQLLKDRLERLERIHGHELGELAQKIRAIEGRLESASTAFIGLRRRLTILEDKDLVEGHTEDGFANPASASP